MIEYRPDDDAPLNKQLVIPCSEGDRDFVERAQKAYGARSAAAICRMAFRIAFPEIGRHAPAQRAE